MPMEHRDCCAAAAGGARTLSMCTHEVSSKIDESVRAVRTELLGGKQPVASDWSRQRLGRIRRQCPGSVCLGKAQPITEPDRVRARCRSRGALVATNLWGQGSEGEASL